MGTVRTTHSTVPGRDTGILHPYSCILRPSQYLSQMVKVNLFLFSLTLSDLRLTLQFPGRRTESDDRIWDSTGIVGRRETENMQYGSIGVSIAPCWTGLRMAQSESGVKSQKIPNFRVFLIF